MAHPKHPPAGLAHDGEGLGEQAVQVLPGGMPLPELLGLGHECGIGE